MGVRTGIVLVGSSILLGSVFVHWLVDYNTLWTIPTPPQAQENALDYYRDRLIDCPVWLASAYSAIVAASVAALLSKVLELSTSAILFDGASLVLYFAWLSSLVTTLRDDLPLIQNAATLSSHVTLETLKNLASCHLNMSVCLTGVLALQSGQYFANTDDPSLLEDEAHPSPALPSPRSTAPLDPSSPAKTPTARAPAAGPSVPASLTLKADAKRPPTPLDARRVTRSVSRALSATPEVEVEIKVPSPKRKKRRPRVLE